MANPHKSELSKQLRWFTGLSALLDRATREDALLERAAEMPARFTEAEEAVTQLLATEPSTEEEVALHKQYEKDLEHIQELYDQILQRAREIARQREGKLVARPISLGAAGSSATGRLPALQVPHFSGCMRDWAGFRNMFTSLVDTRTDLTKAEKLAYLRSFLEGEPQELVQYLELQDASYDTAMELLERRYQNPRLQADSHVTHLLNLPKVSNRAQLREQLITPVTVALNGLRAVGLPVEQWAFLLFHIVLARVPQEIRTRFERERVGDRGVSKVFPTVGELLEFLNLEAQIMDTYAQETSASAPARTPGVFGARKPPTQARGRDRLVAAAATGVGSGCRVCGQLHLEQHCKQLIGMQPQERRSLVRSRGLCYGCLGGHRWNECSQAKPCTSCGGPHHPLLCNRCGDGAARAHGVKTPTGGSVDLRRTPTPERQRSPPKTHVTTPQYAPVQGSRRRGAPEAPAPQSTRGNWREGARIAGPIPEVPITYPPPSLPEQRPRGNAGQFSPVLHEYPRLEYHPSYFPYGRAAGYAPPKMVNCTRPVYWPGPSRWAGFPSGSDT